MQKEILITSHVAADKAGYDFLCKLYNELHDVEREDIIVDFKLCRKFDANLSAVLGAFFDKRKKEGCSIYLGAPQAPGVKRALSRNKFFRAFDLNTTNEDRENYIDFRRFKVEDIKEFKSYIDTDLIQKERFPSCTEKAKDKIKESICEIFANAVDHGNCDYFYCCGEVHPREGKTMLDMTFVNLGVPVVDNVNNFMRKKGLPILNPCETLDWAFVRGNTTKDIPGGLDLDILKEFIGMNDGTIQMISGGAMLEIDKNHSEATKLDLQFPGTIVTVEFNCDDNKLYLTTDETPDTNNLF